MNPNSKRPRQKYIRCLERRLVYLENKLSTATGERHYDKAERNALAWAIEVLKELYPSLKRESETESSLSPDQEPATVQAVMSDQERFQIDALLGLNPSEAEVSEGNQ